MSGTALIVDSVSTNRIICKAKLIAGFYQVLQAETGGAALDIITQRKPDIVILSDNLPDMTANALCRQLKSGETSEWTPIVIFSVWHKRRPDNSFASRSRRCADQAHGTQSDVGALAQSYAGP